MNEHQLIESHIHLAKNIARQYSRRGYDYAECESAAYFVLVNAAKKYNPLTGNKFSTYYSCAAYHSLLSNYDIGPIRYPHHVKKKKMYDIKFEDFIQDKKIDDEYINLECLNNQEKEVIKLRYWEDKKFNDIGRMIGLSMQRAQQIHAKALEKLKRRVK